MDKPQRKNRTLELLRNNKPAIGSWLTLGNVHVARLLAAQGVFDWLLVDLEHSPTDPSIASYLLSSISDVSQGRVTPIVRVIDGTIHHIKMALDSGAHGIIVPMVNSAADARNVISFARFPPLGVRGVGGLLPHLSFALSRGEYVSRANDEILVALQVETAESVENIEEILEVPGIDAIFIGPADLHMSLGLLGQVWSNNEKFLSAIKKVSDACERKKVALGIYCKDGESAKQRMEEKKEKNSNCGGFKFVGIGSDAGFVLAQAGIQAALARGESETPVGSWGETYRGLGK